KRIPPLLAAGQVGTLVLRGMPGSQRLDIAGAIARELGRGLLEIDVAATDGDNRDEVDRRWALHGPLSVLLPAMPVVTADLGPGETVDLPAPAGGVPLAVLMGSEGGLRGTGAAAALTISLPVPAVAERERLWQQAVGETP